MTGSSFWSIEVVGRVYGTGAPRLDASRDNGVTGAAYLGQRIPALLQVPKGVSYVMPAGSVMRLFRRHNGGQRIAVQSCPAGLDIAPSRPADHVFLHVANLEYSRAVEASHHRIHGPPHTLKVRRGRDFHPRAMPLIDIQRAGMGPAQP
jgi:hypothetical protein